jgi:hypothetical protein
VVVLLFLPLCLVCRIAHVQTLLFEPSANMVELFSLVSPCYSTFNRARNVR